MGRGHVEPRHERHEALRTNRGSPRTQRCYSGACERGRLGGDPKPGTARNCHDHGATKRSRRERSQPFKEFRANGSRKTGVPGAQGTDTSMDTPNKRMKKGECPLAPKPTPYQGVCVEYTGI